MLRGYSDTLFPQNTPKKGNQLSWGLAPDFLFAGWLLWTNTLDLQWPHITCLNGSVYVPCSTGNEVLVRGCSSKNP